MLCRQCQFCHKVPVCRKLPFHHKVPCIQHKIPLRIIKTRFCTQPTRATTISARKSRSKTNKTPQISHNWFTQPNFFVSVSIWQGSLLPGDRRKKFRRGARRSSLRQSCVGQKRTRNDENIEFGRGRFLPVFLTMFRELGFQYLFIYLFSVPTNGQKPRRGRAPSHIKKVKATKQIQNTTRRQRTRSDCQRLS